MANPTTATTPQPTKLSCTSTTATLTLEPDREYLIVHTGLDTSGSASTGNVYLTTTISESATPATPSAAENEGVSLASGQSIIIGPSLWKLAAKSSTGTVVISISPSAQFFGVS